MTSTAAPAATRRATVRLVMLIGSLTLLPAVATDLYLPSLPDVAADLHTSEAGAVFTLTGMLLGGAAGQLVVGPFSDRVGRRLPVLIGVSAHALLSLLCAVAQTQPQLAGLRILQGFAAAGATVVAMAVIRDLFSGAEAARLMSRLMLIIGAAPLFAPTIGGFIAQHFGWRGVFVALAIFAAVLVVVVAVALPETLVPERRQSHGLAASFRGYAALLADRRFVALAFVPGLAMSLVLSYVAGSSFVLQGEYELDSQHFALVFALGGTSLVLGSQVNAALVQRVGPARLLRAAAPATAVLAMVLVAVTVTHAGGVVGFVTALWFTLASLGLVTANASALALSRHGERAGTAAATIGFVQTGLAGIVSPLVGVLGGTGAAMTGTMAVSAVLAVVVLLVGTPLYRRDGWVELGTE